MPSNGLYKKIFELTVNMSTRDGQPS